MTVQVLIPPKTIFDNIHTAAKYISWYAETQRTTSCSLTADDAKRFHTARTFLREMLDEIDTSPERAAWYTETATLTKALNKLPSAKQPDWHPLRDLLEELTKSISGQFTNSNWTSLQKTADDLMSLCNYLDGAICKQINAAVAKHVAPLVDLLH